MERSSINMTSNNALRKFLSVAFTFLLFSGLIFAQEKDSRKMEALADTLFKTMSTEELIKIQNSYKDKVEKLRKDEEKIRGKGLEVTESFLQAEGVNITDQDKILIRIAEYYIEDAENQHADQFEEFLVADKKYLDELDLFESGKIAVEPVPPQEPKVDYSKAIGIYDKIITEFPRSDFADDALYSKAYLLEQMNQGPTARQIYQQVIDKYPESHFAAESYMRMAEYFFEPRADKDTEQSIVELQKAIKLYKKVLKYKDSKRYDEALYKLGWSYYKLSANDPKYYSDAIVYFLAVVDDISRAQKMDPKGRITNANVRDEAIQYIGISFTDEDTYPHAGVENAKRFIGKLGKKEYGVEIMRALGETYQKIENYDKAVASYTGLLDMFPQYIEAPIIKRKVAETYYDMGRDADEYRARYELFRDYNPKSEWYTNLEQSDTPEKVKYLEEAQDASEKAIYTNIFVDITKAQELDSEGQPSQAAWEKVVSNCREYLDVFPTDSNAYAINWSYAYILDVNLHRFPEAFEQYIRVSNDFLEKEHQEEAANNAIVVAETLATVASAAINDTSALINLNDPSMLNPEMMSQEEKRLVEAYQNYIRLFPDNEKTPIFLAKAGALYFNKKQFAEAKTYFNTLVKRFPGAKQKSIAMRSIMNSYFALGKFRDSESIAKRIINSEDVPNEEKIFAEQRLAQSIFKNAKLLEEQGQFFESANEYRRVYAEAPEDKNLVEPALFNSGLMYDKIQEWEKALDTYLLLAEKFPDTKNALDALNNAAEDYKELQQFDKAGTVYQNIYEANKANKEIAEPALYNASYYFEKGEAWASAIAANNLYINAYPEETLANDLYFANAGHYLKLGQVNDANRIYEEFAQRYPTDPKAVEAFYRRGLYFKDSNVNNAAKLEFNKAIAKSEEFASRGLDPNRYYAGESLNELVEMLHEEFAQIELKQPESQIQAGQGQMRELLKQIISSNKKIIANGSIRSFEAVFKNAEIYKEFADKFVVQERNPNATAVQKFAESRKINSQAAKLYETAVDQYKQAVEIIPTIAEKFNVDIFAEPAPEEVVVEDTSEVVKRVVESDSTREVALKWYAKARDQISHLLYTQAELTNENVKQAIAAENPQKDPLSRLIFQLRLVNNGVAPAIKQTIAAHKRNIVEANELGLSNKYVEESKRQILLVSNVMADELEKIAFDAIVPYKDMSNDIVSLVEQEYGAKNSRGEDYNFINTNIMQMIDLSRDLAKATINNYASSLALAKQENIVNDLVRTTENRLLRFAVEFTDYYDMYADSAEVRSGRFGNKFASTDNYNFDDASVYFQDHQLAFEDYEREVLDLALSFKDEYEISNLWANKLVMKLFRIDPTSYAESVEKEKTEVKSDEGWLTSAVYTRGYVNEDFDDSSWQNASKTEKTYNQFSELGLDPDPIWKHIEPVIEPQQPVVDSLGMANQVTDSLGLPVDSSAAVSNVVADSLATPIESADTSLAAAPVDSAKSDTVTMYFRKKVDLNGTPVDGVIYVSADDDFRFFINGEYIMDDELNNFAIIDTVDYGTMSYYLKPGVNTFALEVIDMNNSGGGVKLDGYFEVIPSDLSASVEEKARVKEIVVDPVQLKKSNILNKNRISIDRGEN